MSAVVSATMGTMAMCANAEAGRMIGDVADGRESSIQRARGEALKILHGENGCSAWFRETDPEAEAIFDSLHFEIVEDGQNFILGTTDGRGGFLYKHPWGARSYEYAGRDSTVEVNAAGAFFLSSTEVFAVSPGQTLGHRAGSHQLTVGGFRGNTLGAQITTLLHELGHVIGRIPEDSDSWDGRSVKNTQEVLRNCKAEIREHSSKQASRKVVNDEVSQRNGGALIANSFKTND